MFDGKSVGKAGLNKYTFAVLQWFTRLLFKESFVFCNLKNDGIKT